MTRSVDQLLQPPPFPDARPFPVTGRDGAADAGRIPPAEMIARMRRHRVGGAFWGRQPAVAPGTLDLDQAARPADAPVDPWHLFASAREVLGDADDPLLLLAAIAGRPVRCRGDGAFAGLSGLDPAAPDCRATLEALVGRHLLAGRSWHDPFTGERASPLDVVETFGLWRRLIDGNRPIAAAFGFAAWKQDTADPLLWGGEPVPFRHASAGALAALPAGATIAIWKARVPAELLAAVEQGPWRVVEVEDGFIRSAGLGADCVPPLSIIVDEIGVHYDPRRPSGLEAILAEAEFTPEELDRAARLRAQIVANGVGKYGVGGPARLPRPGGEARPHLLVVGQVEDDRSVMFGAAGGIATNQALLERVRAEAPDAFIVFRPHPDVEAGHRKGGIAGDVTARLADAVDADSPISALIAMVDEVHVLTSLAGFEALMQGKPVTAHGMPFYAGWGLTRDRAGKPARRHRRRTADELAAAALLAYPRYLDPVTNLPCTPELLLRRLISGVQRQNGALVPLRRLQGRMMRLVKRLVGSL